MLVAHDASLAKEGPGLVERFLVKPPGAYEAEGPPGGGRRGGGSSSAAARRGRRRGGRRRALRRRGVRLGAGAAFQRYLQHKAVCVDVWDGASLLQIGTARVPLASLLRKGTERVGAASVTKEYLSVDVLDTALTTIDAAPSADAQAVVAPALKGKLKLVIARLSSALPPPSPAAAPVAAPPGSPPRAAAAPEAGGAVKIRCARP